LLGIALALCSSLAWGTGDFLGGVASRRIPAIAVLALSQLVGFAGVGVFVLVAGEPVPGAGSALAAGIAGVCGALGLVALYRGMAVGAMGVVAPIAATSAVIPFAIGLARGESPTPVQIVGVAAALVGVAVVSRESSTDGNGRSVAVGLALVAAAAFGLYFVFIDRAAGDGAAWAVLVARATSCSAAVGVAVVLGRRLAAPRALLVPILLIGIFDVSANVLFAAATQHGLLSIVAVLGSLYPVVTVALARLVLHEELRPSQWAGAGVTLAGAALIAAG
jgi:drug/metabolite transporter (DMT)-like permease